MLPSPTCVIITKSFSIAIIITGLGTLARAQEVDYVNARWTKPKPVPGVVNDGTWNHRPSISGDGLTMYWSSERELAALGIGEQETCCLWVATRPTTDAPWDNARPLDSPILATGRNGGVSDPDVTADGLELFFVRDYYDVVTGEGISWTPDDEIWVAKRENVDEPWDIGAATSLADITPSVGCLSNPSVTGDGLELYFFNITSNSCGGPTGSEILVAKRTSRDEPFGPASSVFSDLEPLEPSISPDGLHLFYRVKRQQSIFVASRSSREEEFVHGPRMSSPLSQGDFSLDMSSDGTTIYFHSNRDGVPTHPTWPFGPSEEVWQMSLAEACDLNTDGLCNVDDIDMLSAAIHVGTNIPGLDLSGDGIVDHADLSQWLSDAAPHNEFSDAYLLGDSDLDGAVDATDLNNLALNWQQNTTAWSHGDFTANGVVDAADLNALALNWRQTIPIAATVNAPVPEPSASILALVGLTFAWGRARRN